MRCQASHFQEKGRLVFWGESAFPFVCSIAWLLEQNGEIRESEQFLETWLLTVVDRQQPSGDDALADPYSSAEDVLKQMAESALSEEPRRPKASVSYSLSPAILLLVRRNASSLLKSVWKRLSKVTLSVFQPASPLGYLEWLCDKGIELDYTLPQPQSYRELEEMAASPPVEKLPLVLREDLSFKLMFMLAFPHRMAWSIIGSLDHEFLKEGDP